MKYFIHLPMKMEPTVSSETSAIRTQTTGNYPKRNTLHVFCWFILYNYIILHGAKNIKYDVIFIILSCDINGTT